MLGVAREAWELGGYRVSRRGAVRHRRRESRQGGSGIASRTLASFEHAGRAVADTLTARDVLVVDEAGMIGTRQMERVMCRGSRAGAKIVLVGDVQQLQAIEAGAAFRLLAERHGAVEIGEVRRQQQSWHARRDARDSRPGGPWRVALRSYSDAGAVHAAETPRRGARRR